MNILEELTPAAPIPIEGRPAATPLAPENDGQNVYKKGLKEYPYTCFVESSGLLVVISHTGYCCKFSIDLQHELPTLVDGRYSGFNSVRASRFSPTSRYRMNTPSLSTADLGQSLALLKEKSPRGRGRGTVHQKRGSRSPRQLTVEIDAFSGPNEA